MANRRTSRALGAFLGLAAALPVPAMAQTPGAAPTDAAKTCETSVFALVNAATSGSTEFIGASGELAQVKINSVSLSVSPFMAEELVKAAKNDRTVTTSEEKCAKLTVAQDVAGQAVRAMQNKTSVVAPQAAPK